MSLTKFTKDMAVISALNDEPNDVGGMTAAELKAKYDEGGKALQGYVNETLTVETDAHITNQKNPHGVDKTQVGLGNVNNTADADKPVSVLQAEALALKANRTDVLTCDNATAYTPTAPYHPATKKYADDVVAGAVMGQVPDNSITNAKLAAGAVTAETLAAESVTDGKLSAAVAKKLNEDKGGSILQLTFDAAFAGRAYTVTAPGESYSGTVPAGLKAEVSIKKCNTTYTVESTTAAGDKFSASITTDAYFGQYRASLYVVSATLEKNDWNVIHWASDTGIGENYWKIGDKKAVTINGKVGNTQFSNLTVYAFILGFNHNAAREGCNRIHFQIGKTSAGTDIALVDSKYNNSVTETGYFSMNATNTNAGGYAGSQMWSNILGNGGTPTSPTANTLLAALPADLRSSMKQVTKYSDNTGGGTDTASFVTATTESLFLLSEWEYHGARSYANSAEQTFQAQYPYYKAGNSKIKYRHDGTTTAVRVWTRSGYATNATNFCNVNADGNANINGASGSRALSPGFCV